MEETEKEKKKRKVLIILLIFFFVAAATLSIVLPLTLIKKKPGPAGPTPANFAVNYLVDTSNIVYRGEKESYDDWTISLEARQYFSDSIVELKQGEQAQLDATGKFDDLQILLDSNQNTAYFGYKITITDSFVESEGGSSALSAALTEALIDVQADALPTNVSAEFSLSYEADWIEDVTTIEDWTPEFNSFTLATSTASKADSTAAAYVYVKFSLTDEQAVYLSGGVNVSAKDVVYTEAGDLTITKNISNADGFLCYVNGKQYLTNGRKNLPSQDSLAMQVMLDSENKVAIFGFNVSGVGPAENETKCGFDFGVEGVTVPENVDVEYIIGAVPVMDPTYMNWLTDYNQGTIDSLQGKSWGSQTSGSIADTDDFGDPANGGVGFIFVKFTLKDDVATFLNTNLQITVDNVSITK